MFFRTFASKASDLALLLVVCCLVGSRWAGCRNNRQGETGGIALIFSDLRSWEGNFATRAFSLLWFLLSRFKILHFEIVEVLIPLWSTSGVFWSIKDEQSIETIGSECFFWQTKSHHTIEDKSEIKNYMNRLRAEERKCLNGFLR